MLKKSFSCMVAVLSDHLDLDIKMLSVEDTDQGKNQS